MKQKYKEYVTPRGLKVKVLESEEIGKEEWDRGEEVGFTIDDLRKLVKYARMKGWI